MSEYSIVDLQSVFVRLNASNWSGILIGGQAVNHFSDSIPDLHCFEPLTSRVLDFHGGPRDARRAMSILEANGKINDGSDPSPNAGVLQVPMVGGEILIVDILTSVFGVSASEMYRSSIAWQALKLVGHPVIQVIHLLLLESKLACLRALNQSSRQDEKHVRLLIQVIHAWFESLLASPREVLRSIERLGSLMMVPDGLAAYDKQIELWDSVPLHSMKKSPLYTEFFNRRLPHLIDQVDRKRQS